MARVRSWNGRYVIVDWNDKEFFLRPPRMHDDKEDLAVGALQVILAENEMQDWVRNPKGMENNFEPDLTRPGNFKAVTNLGRR